MEFQNFSDLMDVLLGENGCPWDREQTHESLRQHILEECYEAIDAINEKNPDALCEELGDVLLQVVFHAKLAEKAGTFSIDDVIEGVSQKLVSRHTHVFGADSAVSGDEVMKIWEANKDKENNQTPFEAMNSVPRALPALVRASKVLKRSKREFFSARENLAEIIEEIREKTSNSVIQSEEFGEILLRLVAVANIFGINAEFSLTNALEAFINSDSMDSELPNGSH